MNGTPASAVTRRRRSATISACFSFSIAHGPPMRASGAPPPMVTDADPDRARPGHAPPWWSSAAWMNAAKSGCGSHGRERNSGWNCPATNHG